MMQSALHKVVGKMGRPHQTTITLSLGFWGLIPCESLKLLGIGLL